MTSDVVRDYHFDDCIVANKSAHMGGYPGHRNLLPAPTT